MKTPPKFLWLEPFEKTAAAIWLRDADNILLWANTDFGARLDRHRDELIGQNLHDLLLSHGLVEDMPDLTDLVIRERRGCARIRAVTFRGETQWLEVCHAPVPPERTAGHGWCVLAHAVNVTAQVQMSALRLLVGMRKREPRRVDGDERFVRLLLEGSTIRGLCTALQMSVEQVTARLSALSGTPLG